MKSVSVSMASELIYEEREVNHIIEEGAMTYLECSECGERIEHEPLVEFIRKSHANPDSVSYLVPCATCGEMNSLIDVPIDEYVFNGEAVVLQHDFNEYDRKVLSHANGFMM